VIRTALAMSGLGGLVVAFVAVLGGMALVTGTGVIIESGLRSGLTGQRLTGAHVIVSAPQRVSSPDGMPVALPERAVVPARLVSELAGLPGVAEAVGDVSFPAAPVAGGTAAGEGHGWSSAALSGKPGKNPVAPGTPGEDQAETGPAADGPAVTGTAPRARDEVALSSAFAVPVGKDVEVVAAGERGRYMVTAVVEAPGLYFADHVAAELAGRTGGPKAGTVDLVALRAEPGTDAGALASAVERRLGERYVVSAGSARGGVGR
jgi:putative ABC transport system permease protein